MRSLYAAIAYAAFLGSSAWAFWFLANTIDAPARHSWPLSLALDGALLLLFAAHHTIAARDAFKRRMPPAIERSTYVLVASLLLCAVFAFWSPVPTTVWHLPALVWLLYGAGWLIVIASTFMVDHFEFFGLTRSSSAPALSRRWLYNWCRHPLMLGLLMTFWLTPRMTVGHLFFAVASSGYIAVGIRFEERALRARFGAAYEEYASQVPALLPLFRTASSRL